MPASRCYGEMVVSGVRVVPSHSDGVALGEPHDGQRNER